MNGFTSFGIAYVIFIIHVKLAASNNYVGSCSEMKTCDACIGVARCTWCTELKLPGSQFQRCNTLEDHRSSGCPRKEIIKAESSMNITKNQPLSNTMRIQPQRVVANLGVGEKVTIELTYKDSGNKPLDLYYIMDLSHTMMDDKKTVSGQAQDLVKELRKITENVRLGFGSFIDKPVLPFVSPAQLRYDENSEYDKPYGFKNSLSLTDNIDRFEKIVKNAKISGNLDSPEGTLDALMQAVTCTEEIGWRNESSKLVVVATDGPFHIAGDGKIGGIVRPNDMKCHLENGMYSHSTILDYPSVSEMNYAIQKHKVFVIFAVSKSSGDDTFSVYEELAKHISHSAAVELKSDSSNVVQEVKTKYQEIRDTVRLNVEKAPKHLVDITVESKCSRNGIYFQEAACKNVEPNSEIRFKITLDLKRCPDKEDDVKDDEIVVSFFQLSGSEKLRIKLLYNCVCKSCNKDENKDVGKLQRYCSGEEASSHISCGTCFCKEGRFGDSCQCSVTGNNNQGNRSNCIDPSGSGKNELCSNRGRCHCGQCDCPQEYNGKYCQDSTENCQNRRNQFSTKLCSDNGRCIKGECHCQQGYEGKHCECQKSKKIGCVEPGKPVTDLCNNHGTCECTEENSRAKCKCEPNYGGFYCEVCKVKGNCPPSADKQVNRCDNEFLQKCVRCRVRKYNESAPKQNIYDCIKSKDCIQDKKNVAGAKLSNNRKEDVSSYEFVELTGSESLEDKAIGTQCRVQLNSTCYVDFRYLYKQVQDTDALEVYYKPKDEFCDPEAPLLWYIFGIIIGVLFAGILGLLIWKLATYLHDRREYQKFEKERALAKWQTSENPLYNKPMREFENPAYRG